MLSNIRDGNVIVDDEAVKTNMSNLFYLILDPPTTYCDLGLQLVSSLFTIS